MFSTIQQQSLSEQKGIIRQTGLRATSSRIAVLDYLRRVERPVSHADVVAAFTDLPWDKTTIYRNLNDFVRVGLARKTELGDRVWQANPVYRRTLWQPSGYIRTQPRQSLE